MKIHTAKELGQEIKRQRKAVGLTQKTLSDFTGVSTSFLSDLENGKETAEIGRTIKVVLTLGLDIELHQRNSNS